jgi:NTE family protein
MKKYLVTFLLFLVFLKANYSQNARFENLVFEGAGIRGIAYSGVLCELEKHNMISGIKRVGGTSAGAITALMVSLGYTSDEICNIISNTKFQKFNDGEYAFIGGFSRLISNYGWYKGDEFNKWLETIISAKTNNSNITFRELEQKGYKQLYVTATCMNKQKLIIFSANNYPQMKIKDAVRISMSIPLYFEAVFIDGSGKVFDKQNDKGNLDVVVDGGIIGNFPIFMFDSTTINSKKEQIRIPNYKTLGIRIDSDNQIKNDSLSRELAHIPIKSMNDYLEAFYILILENLNRNSLIEADWERTISVSSVGIGPRIKKLSKQQKEALINSGENSAKKYFNN